MWGKRFVQESRFKLLNFNIRFISNPSDFPKLVIFDNLVRVSEKVIDKHRKVITRLLAASFVPIRLDKSVNGRRDRIVCEVTSILVSKSLPVSL